MATLFVDKIDPQSGTSLEIGSSGDTISVPNGAMSGQNYPAFEAYTGSDQNISNATYTTINANTEVYDTDSAYDTSTYKFTPQVAGKYFFYGSIRMQCSTANTLDNLIVRIYKNNSITSKVSVFYANSLEERVSLGCTAIIDMNGSTDNVCFQGYMTITSGTPFFESGGAGTYFGAYRIGD